MHIRFLSSPILGPVQFTKGEVLDLPSALAEQLVDDGLAETLTPEDLEALPRPGVDISGFVPPSPRRPTVKRKGHR